MQYRDFDMNATVIKLERLEGSDAEPWRARMVTTVTEDQLKKAGLLGNNNGILVCFNKNNVLYDARKSLFEDASAKVRTEDHNLADLEASLYINKSTQVEVIAKTKEDRDKTVAAVLALVGSTPVAADATTTTSSTTVNPA